MKPKKPASTKRERAAVVREYIPVAKGKVNGVTFDGKRVWFARGPEIVAFDPKSEKVVKRLDVPGDAGTAFDGKHLYQLAEAEILVVDPEDGRIVRRLPAPGKGKDSGMAYADGYLFVGQYRDAKIHKIDAKTGEIVKTLTSDRWVTGVSCVDGELWHATSGDDGPPELRRLGPDGAVLEQLPVDSVEFVSGLESNGKGQFWCGGEGGRLRLVEPTKPAAKGERAKKKRASAR
jgi:hypothetical protein